MSDKIYSYSNFNVDVNGDYFPFLIWSIWACVIIAIMCSLVIRSFLGWLVRGLKNARAVDAAGAKTLEELGIGPWNRLFAGLLLKDSSSILKYVKIANAEEIEIKHGGIGKFWQKHILGRSFSLRDAKFYLPEESRITAESRFSAEEHPVRSFVIAAAVLTAGAVFVMFALPELLLMLDNFISMNS